MANNSKYFSSVAVEGDWKCRGFMVSGKWSPSVAMPANETWVGLSPLCQARGDKPLFGYWNSAHSGIQGRIHNLEVGGKAPQS